MRQVALVGQRTCFAGVFRDKSYGVKVSATLPTSGTGLWSQQKKSVKITALSMGYVSNELDYGELRIFFNRNTWRTNLHGLIYTDPLFEKELQKFLNSLGLAGDEVFYSEQGMQGDNYVSVEFGKKFIDSWINFVYAGDQEQFKKITSKE